MKNEHRDISEFETEFDRLNRLAREEQESITAEISSIGNYYGTLCTSKVGDKFFWSIENHDGHGWKEIPGELHNLIVSLNSAGVI